MRGWVLVLACAGCRASGPEAALEAYRAALARGDASELRRLSDAATREVYDEAEFQRWTGQEARAEAADALGGRVRRLTFELGGRTVVLTEEDDGWRVAEGGLVLPRCDTPERAAATFFFAADALRAPRHLEILRRLIPDEHQPRFATDSALEHHLRSIRPRVERARAELGRIAPGTAVVDGPFARIPYGAGKEVRLREEGGSWRVLDLE